MKKLLILLALALPLSLSAAPARITVSGHVHDSVTGETLIGEHDVLKSLQLLPGVQGGNEGFAGLYVRGGEPD